jgi:hypothetical protein
LWTFVGLLPAPLAAEPIFFDGFDVGSVCAWDAAENAPACCGALILGERFDLADGSPWPAPWVASGFEVAVADVQGGQGRLRPDPSGYSLARMVHPGSTANVQALFTMVLEDAPTQGVGFYARQNGGYLTQTDPDGQGYAVFVEAFRGPAIGVWREVSGVEQEVEVHFDAGLGLTSGVPYRVRFRMDTIPGLGGPTVQLRARVWPAGSPEPANWQVDAIDDSAALQGVVGGFAVDSWSELTSGITAHTRIDDIQIFDVCTE